MRTAELLERRRKGWKELESMCEALSSTRFPYRNRGSLLVRFSALYRAACTDLSMAEQYQLPPTTVEYLHRLVGRAHSQLYRSQRLPLERWWEYVMLVIPHAIFRDICVLVAGLLFFGSFTLSALMASSEEQFPKFPEAMVGSEQIKNMEEMYTKPLDGTNSHHYLISAGGYIKHNAGIGLQCFAFGPLLLPTLCMLGYNGTLLGAVFGYMIRSDVEEGDNFLQFVTAHGAFELTAIALAAAAGLRVGIGLFATGGLLRTESLRLNAERSIPVIMCSVILFVLAAFTEGCLSPSGAPYLAKAAFAVFSSTSLICYFVLLGVPTEDRLRRLASNEDNPWRRRDYATR